MKPTKATIIRTIVAALAILNTVLTLFDKNPFPFTTEQVEAFCTAIFDIVATIVVWWKNNSFTKQAIEADAIMRTAKALAKMEAETDVATAIELSNGKENDYE